MAESAARAPDDPDSSPARAESRMHPGQLVAYYALLFLFMWLSRQLLREMGVRYDLSQFEKVNQLIKNAINPTAGFDDVANTLFSLLLSFLITMPIAWVYTMTKDEDRFDPSLVQTIVVLSMIVTSVMIVIGNELARAFGLAGVVAAVRFRNSLDDAKDAVYVFIAIGVGMACGTRLYHIAVWISVVMTLTMYLLWRFRFGRILGGPGGALARANARKKEGGGAAPVSAASQKRIEQAVEQQYRLVQWASMAGGEKKRPNAALLIVAADGSRAQRHVEGVLEAWGKWQLAHVTSSAAGGVTLEYVGRCPKEAAPAEVVQALMRSAAAGGVQGVEYRSLKGLKAPGFETTTTTPVVS